MNIGILGAKGFIGSNVSLKCKHLGINVTEYGRDFKLKNHDVIIHFAQPNKLSSIENNKDLSLEHHRLINELKNHCQKLVYISSAAVLGNKYDYPVDEKETPNPIDNYGKFKYSCETHIQNNLSTYLIIRPSNVYGLGMDSTTVIGDYLAQFKEGKTNIHLKKAYPIRDFIFIEDFVDGLLKLVVKNLEGIYNISSGAPTSIKDLADVLDKFFGLNTTFELNNSNEVDYLVLEPAKLIKDTAWEKPKEFSDKFCYYLENYVKQK